MVEPLGAWLSIYGTAWMVVAVAAVYTPGWVDAGVTKNSPGTSLDGQLGVDRDRDRWPLLPVGFDGDVKRTGKMNAAMQIVALVAPFVFIAGLLIASPPGWTSSSAKTPMA